MKITSSALALLVTAATSLGGVNAFLSTSRTPPQRLPHLPAISVDAIEGGSNDSNNDGGVDFPPPLTTVQRTKRAIEFYKRVLPVLAAYKAKEVELDLRRKTGFNIPDTQEEEQMWADMDEWGSSRIAETIQEMKGFYVKTGQVISTRVDLFPEAYTSKLQELQDGIEAMPFDLVEKVVRQELLDGAPLSELFASFEETPLGSASIAQVHKATLLDGRTVAVKLQRPNVEPKLLGDVANLKRISKTLRDSLPVDYYTVFCELGDALINELDFLAEAQAMRKIDMAISHDTDGTSTSRPVGIPLPVGELVTKRVLVMDFVEGVPLNKLQEKLRERGIEPGSPESKIAGRRILDSLALAFGRMIFGAGFIHGDPHPGNIFIGEGAKVTLIDCGQFKALPRQQRLDVAEIVLAVGDYQNAAKEEQENTKRKLADLVRGFGVTFMEGKEEDDDLACSVALVLFGDADQTLPGGYSNNELSDESPIKQVASFPQELVLLGRATVLLKGIAKRLDVNFSLAERWADGCRLTMSAASKPSLPIWGKEIIKIGQTPKGDSAEDKIRFRQVGSILKEWGKGKSKRFAWRAIEKLSPKTKTRVMEYMLKLQERKESKK
mmetsp:Transcript_30809/g.46972  ORF Transcript_30809/g.46972 Transcript_30809/m.46972 type:complete len:608 (-) Transcript_30809:16-1839(-)